MTVAQLRTAAMCRSASAIPCPANNARQVARTRSSTRGGVSAHTVQAIIPSGSRSSHICSKDSSVKS